jgi:hypothetical protein
VDAGLVARPGRVIVASGRGTALTAVARPEPMITVGVAVVWVMSIGRAGTPR